jgi:hypothetical protein
MAQRASVDRRRNSRDDRRSSMEQVGTRWFCKILAYLQCLFVAPINLFLAWST